MFLCNHGERTIGQTALPFKRTRCDNMYSVRYSKLYRYSLWLVVGSTVPLVPRDARPVENETTEMYDIYIPVPLDIETFKQYLTLDKVKHEFAALST